MKKLLITALLSFVTLTSANAAHPQCGETELAEIMSSMKDNMKAIKAASKEKDSAKISEIAAELLVHVQDSAKYVPLAISDKKELTAQQQADFDKYQKGMKALEKAVLELKNATSFEQQKAALGLISKASKKGHKAFKMDCDD